MSPGKVTGNWIKRFNEWANVTAKKFELKINKKTISSKSKWYLILDCYHGRRNEFRS